MGAHLTASLAQVAEKGREGGGRGWVAEDARVYEGIVGLGVGLGGASVTASTYVVPEP